jgi:hypothetical protein
VGCGERGHDPPPPRHASNQEHRGPLRQDADHHYADDSNGGYDLVTAGSSTPHCAGAAVNAYKVTGVDVAPFSDPDIARVVVATTAQNASGKFVDTPTRSPSSSTDHSAPDRSVAQAQEIRPARSATIDTRHAPSRTPVETRARAVMRRCRRRPPDRP